MRFEADSYIAFTWEADVNGNKIAGTEEHIGTGKLTLVSGHSDFIRHVEDRATRTQEDRYVIGELWEVDGGRPSMRLFATPAERRGRKRVPWPNGKLAKGWQNAGGHLYWYCTGCGEGQPANQVSIIRTADIGKRGRERHLCRPCYEQQFDQM